MPWQSLGVAALFAGLLGRMLAFVSAHAVNLLYWDQWDFYRPLFDGQGWWATFDRQHGPHRQGLGLVLTRVLAAVSGWNSRWEAFAVLAGLAAAAALALPLAVKGGVPRRSLALAAVPLIFFNVHQYEIFTGAVNLSYAAVPLLLLTGACLCWHVGANAVRLVALSILTFLLIFTGFGFFAGLIMPLLFALEILDGLRTGRRREAAQAAAALASVGASWVLFARGYTFQPAVEGFRFPYEHPLQYLVFVARLIGHAYGMPLHSGVELAVGSLLALALVAIAAWNGWVCARRGPAGCPRSAVLFLLSGFCLLFCINCAVGRVFTSDIAPYASRYVAFTAPAGLAYLLQLAALAGRGVPARSTLALALLLVPATAWFHGYELEGADWYANGRRAWKAEYLRTGDEEAASKASGFRIYPAPLGDRLDYLRRRKLNLFQDDGGP